MTEYLNILGIGIMLASAWWLFSFKYRKYRIELARSNLFAIRDRLFLLAAQEKLDFNTDAYAITRSTLNGMIKFTHTFSLTSAVVLAIRINFLGSKIVIDQYREKVNDSLNKLPDEHVRLIKNHMMHAHLIIMAHIVSTSFVLFTLTMPIIFLLRVVNKMNKFTKFLSKKLGKTTWLAIDMEANCRDSESRGKTVLCG